MNVQRFTTYGHTPDGRAAGASVVIAEADLRQARLRAGKLASLMMAEAMYAAKQKFGAVQWTHSTHERLDNPW